MATWPGSARARSVRAAAAWSRSVRLATMASLTRDIRAPEGRPRGRRTHRARPSGSGSTTSAHAQKDRLGSDGPIRREALDDLGRDLATQQMLDLPKEPGLVYTDQRDRLALSARSAGPADAVDVVLGHHRQLEVHDVGQGLDVEAARRDVGRDEDRDLVRLEVLEGPESLTLALVAVDRRGADAVRTSWWARRSAPCLVRVKTRAW